MPLTKSDPLNVLLVDDQPQKLLAYEVMLAPLGERLLRAESGRQAFDILLHQEVAVILLDVNMPGMDGFETAAAIREHPRFSKTPLIFVTAINTTELDRLRGYEIGAADYVSVPVIPEILRAKVAAFVELHRIRRELERANQSLAEGERRMRAILETAQDAIITMDGQGRLQSVNPATERIFGFSESALVGQHLGVLFSPHIRAEFDEAMSNRLQNSSPLMANLNREFQGQRKDGSIVSLEVVLSETIPGKVYTGIIRDISWRKQLEREVTEVAAAEQRRIGQELHDGVSQELTGLSLMATALCERLDHDQPTQVLSRRIADGLTQVHKQVRQVSHGLVPVEVDAEGLRAALEDLADRLRQQAGVDCAFICPKRVYVRDSLTATHLYSIVQEATNNALRHANPRRIVIQLEAHPESLVLTVSDDGIGMPNHTQRRNGVGLRLMQYRAGLIGGVLRIAPANDGGTLITCVLPESANARA